MIDHYVLSDMLALVKRINPDYPADRECDFGPLRKIATFIYNQLKGQDLLEADSKLFIKVWEQLYTTAYNDPFYSDKSLSTIANHIQEFYQKAKNGSKQIAGSKLKDKLAARFKQG